MTSPIKGFSLSPYPAGSLTQYFGENKALYSANVCHYGKCLQGHNGLDIVAPWGTPIFAVEGGVVCDVKSSPDGYGMHVRVLSSVAGNPSEYREWTYGHLSRIDVTPGTWLTEGQQLGLMGNTGFVVSGATPYWEVNPFAGTHLHLGVRRFIANDRDYTISYLSSYRGNIAEYENGFLGAIDPASLLKGTSRGPVHQDQLLTFISILNQTAELLRKMIRMKGGVPVR